MIDDALKRKLADLELSLANASTHIRDNNKRLEAANTTLSKRFEELKKSLNQLLAESRLLFPKITESLVATSLVVRFLCEKLGISNEELDEYFKANVTSGASGLSVRSEDSGTASDNSRDGHSGVPSTESSGDDSGGTVNEQQGGTNSANQDGDSSSGISSM